MLTNAHYCTKTCNVAKKLSRPLIPGKHFLFKPVKKNRQTVGTWVDVRELIEERWRNLVLQDARVFVYQAVLSL